MTDLIQRLTDAEHSISLWEDVFRAAWPEPPKGPWYWRNPQWRRWQHAEGAFVLAVMRGRKRPSMDWLLWLFPQALDALIPADPYRFTIAALKAGGNDAE